MVLDPSDDIIKVVDRFITIALAKSRTPPISIDAAMAV